MNTLKFLLLTQLKRSKLPRKSGGFTLIELLVALIMAALIITPLLGFMINILSTDRQEQAKATSEQEIQAAADYIARDLQQAVYIYDAQALNNDHNTDGTTSGIKNQLKAVPNGTPVLAFWKRELVPEAVPINGTNCQTANAATRAANCNDAFVYSLVTYYLIKDSNDTWSDAARIARFQISDGVENPNQQQNNPNDDFLIEPDDGFAPFNLGLSGSLRSKMNRWQKDGDYDPQNVPQVLVDYIDHSTTNLPPHETCPSDSDATDQDPEWTQVPSNAGVNAPNSFYACVYSSENIARVYLRGNALARIQSNNIEYAQSKSSYFPTATIQVKGVGGLGGG